MNYDLLAYAIATAGTVIAILLVARDIARQRAHVRRYAHLTQPEPRARKPRDPVNEIILDLAAEYVNTYRASHERRYGAMDARDRATLRGHVTRKFGATYAAILAL